MNNKEYRIQQDQCNKDLNASMLEEAMDLSEEQWEELEMKIATLGVLAGAIDDPISSWIAVLANYGWQKAREAVKEAKELEESLGTKGE